MLKAAVIGVGAMGRNHARILTDLKDVRLVAAADLDAEALRFVVKRYGLHGYTDYRKLLERERPDFVCICVPTSLHEEVALAAISRGVHILVEKPIATTVEAARHMIAAAQVQGVLLSVGHIERFNPAVQELKQHLLAGELGRLFHLHARRLGPFPSRVRDIGVVVDLAPHDIDIMRFLTGSEIRRVYAETTRNIHSHGEDSLFGLLRFSNNATGSLETNWLTPTKVRELSLTGEKGMFRADYLTQDLYFFENSEAGINWESLQLLRGVSEGRMIRYPIQKREPLHIELEQFVAALLNGGPPPVSGEDGLRALTVALAMVRSGLDHQVIVLEAEPA